MRPNTLWLLLFAGLTFNNYLAQAPVEVPAQSKGAGAPHNYNISSAQKELKNPIPYSGASAGRGKNAFLSRCAHCHGPNADGKGNLAAVIGVKPPDFHKPGVLSARTDGELFFIIGTGSENMPSEKITRVTAKQRWDIVNYLRSVEGKTPADGRKH